MNEEKVIAKGSVAIVLVRVRLGRPYVSTIPNSIPVGPAHFMEFLDLSLGCVPIS